MLKITLDTNVVIEGIDGKKASVVASVKKLAEEGKIDIALTTRVVHETRTKKHLKEFEQYPVVGTVGRYGVSRYGQDFYA